MKKILFILIALLILSACAPVLIGSAIVTGVNVAHDRRSAGQVLDDKIITASVKNELRKSLDDDSRIKIESYNGVVLLAGEVKSDDDRIQAEDSAAIKDGVIKVVNELKLVNEISKVGRRSKDGYISSKAKASLLKIDIDGFDPTRVKITTANKEVYLMGIVSRNEADAVVERIRHLRGVDRVVKIFEYTD
ncbi:BON domain-containing protein [Marinicella litoralis]|uniref:Osmotically-inducible protein OsmY n=1 Tax=Marinicella litoralis TaxID=644220 RepID=A0A4V6PXX1_9GAMM|nr:BON domain-containing protein [Marinicella litoralis]TDR20821.1 osmotically-inducible protein OsmY [Marinicella litoralis]